MTLRAESEGGLMEPKDRVRVTVRGYAKRAHVRIRTMAIKFTLD